MVQWYSLLNIQIWVSTSGWSRMIDRFLGYRDDWLGMLKNKIGSKTVKTGRNTQKNI